MTHGDLIPGTFWSLAGAWPGSSTSAAWDQLILPWISWQPGTCWKLARGRRSARISTAATSNGNAAKPGHSSNQWGAVWYYLHSNPPMSLMGQRSLQRIMADTPPS